MGEKLRQSDISEPNLFGELVQSAKALEDQLKETNTELNKSTKVIIDAANKADAMSQKGINNLIKMQKLMEANFKRAQTIDREKIKTAKLLSSAKNQQAAEDRRIAGEKRKIDKEKEAANRRAIADGKRLRADQEKAAKLAQKTRRATLDNANAYKTLSKNVNSASARLKRMAAQYGATDKRTIRAQKNFDRLEKKLRGVNNAARDGRRDVGRYGTALNGVKGSALKMLGALGLLGGGLAIFRGAFNTIKNFEQSIANLSAITGASGKDLEFLKDKAIELGKVTTLSATQVAEGFKIIASAKPELLQDAKALAEVTKQTIILAEAAGMELPEAAEAVTNALNQFGAGADEAAKFVDVLAAGSKFGAGDINFLNEAMVNVGTIAASAGLGIQETVAALELLAEKGLPASKAGNQLKNVLLNLQKEGKGFVNGKFNLQAAISQVGSELEGIQDPAKKAAAEIKLFGKENLVAGQTLLDNKGKLSELTTAVDENGVAVEQQAKNNNTLSGSIKSLGSQYEAWILKSSDAGGVTDGLKWAIQGLADNFETVIRVLLKVVAVVVQFKLAMKALKIYQNIGGLKGLGKAFKSIGGGAKTATSQTKKLGKALKGIGFGLAVTAGLELLKLLWDLASGTAELRRQEDLLAAAREVSAKAVDKVTKPLDRKIKEDKKKLELDLAKGNIQQLEFEQKMKVLEEKKLKRLTAERDLRAKQIVGIEKKNAALKKEKEARNVDVKDFAMSESGQRSYANAVDRVNRANAESNRLIEKNNKLIVFKQETETAFAEAIDNTSDAIHDYTVNIADNSKHLGSYTAPLNAATDGVEDLTKAFKKLSEVDIQGILDAGQSQEEIEDEEIAQLTEAISNYLLRKQTLINDAEREGAITAKEAARLRKEAQLKALEDEKKILILYKRDIIEIDNQISSARLGLMEKGIDEEAAAQSAADKKKKDAAKKLRDELKKIGVQALDELIKISQEKQSLIDDEISKSKELEDRLRDGAKNGNAIATESLAEQESITEEKTRQKQREAKKEALLEEAKAIWNALNNFLDQGDKLPVAGAKAIGGVLGIKTLVNGLTGFFKGTKGRLKDEHKAQVSGKDGHVVRVDGNEAILTGSKMDKLAAAGLTTTDDIVNSAILNQQLIGIPMANAIDDRLVGTDNSAMEKKLDTLIDISKNNKPTSMHPVFKRGLIHAISEAEKKNGKITRNWTYK